MQTLLDYLSNPVVTHALALVFGALARHFAVKDKPAPETK